MLFTVISISFIALHASFPVKLSRIPKLRFKTDVFGATLYSEIYNADDSKSLKKARLRLAEVQGRIPIGASELSDDELKELKFSASPSKVREISWRVAEPEIQYNAEQASSRLMQQPSLWLGRNIKIFVPITIFVGRVILDVLLNREKQNRQFRAKELLRIISIQSPAMIKAGQSLASRSDLLPAEYLEALQQLQDRCPPYPTEQAMALFEQELQTPFDEVFTLDSPEPIAAASIGQVYKGVLKSNGASVAIKIQRPNCEASVAVDLFILRWYAERLQSVLTALGRDVNLISVIDDFGELLYRELDYRAEAVNAQRFAELYVSFKDVFVPKVYPTLSSSKVLVMEWVDGARLNDAQAVSAMGYEKSRFIDTLVQCSMRQMLENGFFHADPHAGNLLAMPDGKLCYLDFGMVSYVEAPQRYSIIEAVVHMVNRDFRALAELYRRMGFIPADVDIQPIVVALENALPDVLNSAVGDFNFKNVIAKLGDVMYKFPFSLPPFYIAIIRCLGVLEGLAIQVDKDFRIISDAYPYIASRLLTDPSEELQAALQQLLFKEGALRWDRLGDLLQEATQVGDYDVSQALDQMVAYLASEQGRAVREALARDSVELLDRMESESLDLLRDYLSRSGADTPAALLRLAVSTGQRAGEEGLRVALTQLVDHFLVAVEEHAAPSAALRTVARVVSALRGSGSLTTTRIVATLKKVLREPVLGALLAQVLSELADRLAGKIVRRVLGPAEGDIPSTTSQ